MRVHFRVYGSVQGVGFRFFVVQSARRQSLTGWVKNCSNGTVEGEVQGGEKEIGYFLEELETKDSWARVDRIHRQVVAGEEKEETDFQIVF